MSYSGETGVFEDLRTYFSTTEWNQLADIDRDICLNIMENHLFKLSLGLTSVPPEFMTRDDDSVAARRASFPPRPSEEGTVAAEGKQHEEWSLHLSGAHTETHSTIHYAEQERPAGDHSVCDLCNRFYSECEEREPPAFMADSHVAAEDIHRANGNTLPPRFGTSQSGVPDARPGGFYREDYEPPGGREEAATMQLHNYDHVDAKEEMSSQREEKTYRLTFARKKTHASKRRHKSLGQSERPKTRRPIRDRRKPFHCEQCDKHFGRSSDLKRHRRIHTGERPFRCDRCAKSFSETSHLKAHRRVHDGEKPFRCDRCDKSFSQPGGLHRHRRLHTGEKPFGCARCDKNFGELAHLKRHQHVHDGERPFPCAQCHRSFGQPGHLKAHQRVHTGERLFRCAQCDRSFSQLAGLGKHRLVHAEERRSKKK